MTTDNIKNKLIEKVIKMNSRDAKKFFGLMMEHNLNDTFYTSFNDIPAQHKLALSKGIDDFKKGRTQSATEFAKNMKNKYA